MTEKYIEQSPLGLKGRMWQQFCFYEVEGKNELDKSQTAVPQILWEHDDHEEPCRMLTPGVEGKTRKSPVANQTTITNTLLKLLIKLERANDKTH